MFRLIFLSALVVALIAKKPPNDVYETDTKSHRSVIFMIADGFGVSSQTLARSVNEVINRNGSLQDSRMMPSLPLDDILVGSIKTRSLDRLITDSAAGATAFASGVKTNNYCYGLDGNGEVVATLMEAAKLNGMLTAIVVTSNITHATPAAFVSHGIDREHIGFIARDIVRPFLNEEPLIDIFMGGGRAEFTRKQNVSQIYDAYNNDQLEKLPPLLKCAKNAGYNLILDRNQFDQLDLSDDPLPVLGLFSDSEMSYEIERDPKSEPSLVEMVNKTLEIIQRYEHKYNGFLLLVEGSRIDMAAHDNDAATHVFEVLGYNQAVESCKRYTKTNQDRILLISTADHETGGLALGRKSDIAPMIYPIPYSYDPNQLLIVRERKSSLNTFSKVLIDYYCSELRGFNASGKMISKCDRSASNSAYLDKLMNDLRYNLTEFFRIGDPESIPDHFIDELYASLCQTSEILTILLGKDGESPFLRYKDGQKHGYSFGPTVHCGVVARSLGSVLASLARVSWATPGHTGQDVMLYATGATSDELRGCHENTYLFTHIGKFLELDMDSATEYVKKLEKESQESEATCD